MSPTQPPTDSAPGLEPPITPLEPVEPAFDPAAASGPGPTGPLPSPDDPEAPYGAFGDSTGTTTILHEGDHVRVERETYPRVDVEIVEPPVEPISPPPDIEIDPYKGIDGPIVDIRLEDLLDLPIAPDPPTDETSSLPSDDDGAEGRDDKPPGRSGARFFRP